MTPYRLSAAATCDLLDLLNYIENESGQDRAIGVHEQLLDAFRSIAQRPRIGHHHAWIADTRARVWTVNSILIVYWPDATPLTIARILHGARDLGTIDIPSPD